MATTNAQTFTIGGVTHQVEDVGARQLIADLQAALNAITSGDTTTAIKTFNEIIAFLDNIEDSSTLQGIIAGLNTAIAAKYTKPGTGIPATDLAQAVQAILDSVANKANSADVYPKSQTYDKDEVDAAVADAGKVKSVTINGTKKTPNETTGDVDLGTIVGQQGPQGEQGPAGPQGNSGVASADGIESVNNLNGGTTDTAEKVYVLGANMGKELGDRLNALEGVEVYTRDSSNDHDGKLVHTSTGNYWGANDYSLSRKILLKAGQTINVHVTGGAGNSCVIVLSDSATEEAGYKSTSNGSIAYVSGTTDYSYTATNDIYVAIGYKTADGFTATINTGSQMIKNKNAIEEILANLNGVSIPLPNQGWYEYSNGALTLHASSSTDKRTLHSDKILLSDFSHIIYYGESRTYNGAFIAMFYDSEDNFIGFGGGDNKFNREYAIGAAIYHYVDIKKLAPTGAYSVVLQGAISSDVQVYGITNTYKFQIVDDWQKDIYGIVGDGATDDTIALQRYIDATYGTAIIPKGKYLITAPIYINTTKIRKIVGNGSTIIIDADNYASGSDVLGFDIYGDHTGSADPNKTSAQMFNSGFVMEDVHITSKTGLAWHDNQTGSDVGKGLAIRIRSTSMLTLRGCEIYAVNDGIEFYGGNRNSVIEGCFIYNCWNNGIVFANNSNLHQINIVGCHISYCKTLINLDNCDQVNNFQISGCDLECARTWPYGVEEGTKCCIRIYQMKDIMNGQIEITGCTIQAHANRDGGSIDAEYLIDITAEIQSNNRFAMYTSIVGNHMSNVGQYAIRINGGDQYTIAGNTVGNTGGSATNSNDLTGGLLYLEGTVSDIAVTGNTLRNHYGIIKDAYMVNVDEDASVTRLAMTGNVGNNTPITIDGASQDYISVVGNNLGGGTVTVGDATHKVVENNI